MLSIAGSIASTRFTVSVKPPRSVMTAIGVTTNAMHMSDAWIVSVQETARKPPMKT